MADPEAEAKGSDAGSGDGSDDEEPIIFQPSKAYAKKGEEEAEPEEYGQDHGRLLYLVSLYAQCATSAEDPEGWLRQMPLNVLMFQGITEGVLDFDYAPCSSLVSSGGRSQRVWLNVTQEGKAAIDDLREAGLLNGLKLSTEDFQPVTAYQVSMKGREMLKIIPPELFTDVDSFAKHNGALKHVQFDPAGGEEGEPSFALVTDTGFKEISNVTEAEDVSYVSSPYLPVCLRNPLSKKALASNAHRAHESALGESNIADELSEAIVLGNVHGMVGEWIPFGSNQIVALNERLGALDRCQGGLFTAMVDDSPTDTQISVPPGLTQVTILDFDFVHFINFEAEINFPEDDGIVQIENFGMHLNVDGTIVYGVKVEAVLDRGADDISLDHLSRVLVDVHQDSSKIMNDLLSQYQRSLLDMIFMGDTQMRNKFNCIVAEEIKPKRPADDYMDKGEFENELKQVLGDIRACHDIGDEDVVIMGRDGVLLAGPHAINYEELFHAYLSLLVREIFIRNFFIRTFVLDDTLKTIRTLIMTYHKDPNHITTIRAKLNVGSRDVILLMEVLEYLKESLEEMVIPAVPADDGGRRLFKVLGVPTMRNDIMLRCSDLVKLIEGAHHQLLTLQQMTEVINTRQLEGVFKNVETNTKFLVDASAAQERSSASLEVMQIILAGSFAFDIIDRLTGGTLNIVVPSWVDEVFVAPVISIPFLFWVLNMCWLGLVCFLLKKFMDYLGTLGLGFLSVRLKVNRKLDLNMLEKMLEHKAITTSEVIVESTTRFKKVAWSEDDATLWQGAPPDIQILVDAKNGFLLTVYFQIDAKKTALREVGLMALFDAMLKHAGVYGKYNPKTEKHSKRMSVVELPDKAEHKALEAGKHLMARTPSAAVLSGAGGAGAGSDDTKALLS